MKYKLMVAGCGLLMTAHGAAQTVQRVDTDDADQMEQVLPLQVNGRTLPEGGAATTGSVRRQWPGTYFETAFDGSNAGFRVGPGDVHLRVTIDRLPPMSLMKPQPGLYRIVDLAPGAHRVRIDVVNESQDGPTTFGGFFAAADTQPLPLESRARQIEFIGDSHTVGYGNTSLTRECTGDEIWWSTDTSQGIAPRVAQRFGADYQVNAISGRGIVRNYNGGTGDPLPQAYPFILFDKAERYQGSEWAPQVIVIALGTNDFSTPLNPGEPWATRDALHADFVQTYVRFVQMLRERNPEAQVILWATDGAEGEIQRQVQKVVAALNATGDSRVSFVPVSNLELSGCDWHPSLADDEKIANLISAAVEAEPGAWDRTGAPHAAQDTGSIPAN